MAHRLEKDVNSLVEKLLMDYEQGRDIDVVEDFHHPNRDDIVKIITQLQNIIFPGYYKNKNYRVYTVRNNLSMQLEDVLYNLSCCCHSYYYSRCQSIKEKETKRSS